MNVWAYLSDEDAKRNVREVKDSPELLAQLISVVINQNVLLKQEIDQLKREVSSIDTQIQLKLR